MGTRRREGLVRHRDEEYRPPFHLPAALLAGRIWQRDHILAPWARATPGCWRRIRLERKSRYAEKGLLIEHETEWW